jgi:DNA-binding NarL/FixJ family response regulator
VSLKILLVDDNPAIRDYLRTFIHAKTTCTVCGEAENGQIAIEKVLELQPHIVILDLSMPVMNGLDAAKRLSHIAPDVVTVLFTLHDSPQLQRAAREVGIRQVIPKSEGMGSNLLSALETVCAQL